MATQDQLSNRFSQLLQSGMSVEEAWKVLSEEILANPGEVAPRSLESSSTQPQGTATGRIPIYESKLLKVIRIDPTEDNRIRTLLDHARRESSTGKNDAPTESSVIRQALRLGLDELERQERQNTRR